MKRLFLSILVLSIFLLGLQGISSAEDAAQKQLPPLEKIISDLKPVVAKVEGKPIKKEEIQKILTELYPMLQSNPQTASMDVNDILKRIVQQLIDEKILFLELDRLKIVATKDDVDKELNGIYGKFGGKENFQKFLAEKKIEEKEFEKNLNKNVVIGKLMQQEVYDKVSLTEEEAKKFYDENPDKFKVSEQVKVSHILVHYVAADGPEKKKEAMKKIEKIKAEADKGADFTELAKKSDGPSAPTGGELGYIRKGQMFPAFEEAAFKLKKDQISGIVETPLGFHIIKVTDSKPASNLQFEDIKAPLMQQLKGLKAKSFQQKYYEDLRKKYKNESFI